MAGKGTRTRHHCPWTRFASGPLQRGAPFGQRRRKASLIRKDGGNATPAAKRASRRAIRRDSATTSQVERWGGTYGDEASFPTLPFASCFAYLPGGIGPICDEGRLLCARLKASDQVWLPRLAARVWLETVGHGRFAAAFGARVVLVPVPGSTPFQRADWIGARLAWCLKEVGLAAEVWPVLRRQHAVKKSAFAAAGKRPTVLEHHASFALEGEFWQGAHDGRGLRLTLVDDVITRGRTLLAAAARIQAALPGAEVRAFALVRTLSPDETLSQVLDPCEGEVRWVSDDARRRP